MKESNIKKEEGWYWISDPREGDIFAPVYVNSEGSALLVTDEDTKLLTIKEFGDVDWNQALMPNDKEVGIKLQLENELESKTKYIAHLESASKSMIVLLKTLKPKLDIDTQMHIDAFMEKIL